MSLAGKHENMKHSSLLKSEAAALIMSEILFMNPTLSLAIMTLVTILCRISMVFRLISMAFYVTPRAIVMLTVTLVEL